MPRHPSIDRRRRHMPASLPGVAPLRAIGGLALASLTAIAVALTPVSGVTSPHPETPGVAVAPGHPEAPNAAVGSAPPEAPSAVVGSAHPAAPNAAVGSAYREPPSPQSLLQLQQDLNNLKITLGNTIARLEIDVDNLERETQDLRYRLQGLERDRALVTTPPSVGPAGLHRAELVVAETVEAEQFLLRSPAGNVTGRLGMTNRGPGLTILSRGLQEVVSLVATEDGAELRLSSLQGGVRVVLTSAGEQGSLILYDAAGNEIYRQ